MVWFKETVQYADFVGLKMNVGYVEMKFLADIFESGTLCFVHELFLGCSESEDAKAEIMSSREHFMDVYKCVYVRCHMYSDYREKLYLLCVFEVPKCFI